MEKRVLKFWTSHTERSPAYWREWFCLPGNFEFVFETKNPDYLIVTEHIYCDAKELFRFLKLNNGHSVTIFISGEAISPDFNLFDYACGFDRHLKNQDRFIRKPSLLFFRNHVFHAMDRKSSLPEVEFDKKTGFCNFIYSNPCAHPARDRLFHNLSRYRKVDSLGPHLNNCGNRTTRSVNNWRELLVEMKRPYKFSIAAENARFNGYVTEKLISSFQACTVPIYWGDETVVEEFNPKAFINANGMADDELLGIVAKIDGNKDLWCEIVSQPAVTASQNEKLKADGREFADFFLRLFDERPIEEKKRVPSGFWNDIYRRSHKNPLMLLARYL